MANCGSLAALGTGDVKFRYSFSEKQVVFTLKGCLYAPMAPINLLSVGALVEHGFTCLFSPGGVTSLSYSDSHPRLPGLSLGASVLNRLSFLSSTSFLRCLCLLLLPSQRIYLLLLILSLSPRRLLFYVSK